MTLLVRRSELPILYGESDLAQLLGISYHEAINAMVALGDKVDRSEDGWYISRCDLYDALGAPEGWEDDPAYSPHRVTAGDPRIVYTPREVAKMLGLSQNQVLTRIKDGRIPGGRMWLRYFVLKQVAHALLEAQK